EPSAYVSAFRRSPRSGRGSWRARLGRLTGDGCDIHSQGEAQLAEALLNFIQRFFAEVLVSNEFLIGLGNQIPDRPNLGGLEAVRGSHGKLNNVDGLIEQFAQTFDVGCRHPPGACRSTCGGFWSGLDFFLFKGDE